MSRRSIKSEEDKNLYLDKMGKGKTQEQINKHTIDDSLESKPIERALLLLNKGDDIQKMSVIQALPQLCQMDSNGTGTRVIPKLQQELVTGNTSSEFHSMASSAFSELICNGTYPNLIRTVLQCIDCKDVVAANSWVESLLGIIPALPEATVKTQILPVAVQKAGGTATPPSKIISARILAAIATYPKMKTISVEKEIVPLILSLSRDSNAEVKIAMCSNMPAIINSVARDFMKTNILPSIVELASDKDMNVRGASIDTTVYVLQFLDENTLKKTMLPLITQICDKSLGSEDQTAGMVAGKMGQMLKYLRPVMNPDHCNWCLKCYKELSKRGLSNAPGNVFAVDATKEVTCREMCAINLPLMAQFTKTALPAQMELFYTTFRELAKDPCYIVRRTVAGTLADIVRTMEGESKNLRTDIVRLLRDDVEDVLEHLVPIIGDTLNLLSNFNILNKDREDACTKDVGRALFKCHMELTKGINWRLLTQLLKEMECLPQCMPGDFVNQTFTPVILSNALNGRARPVRSQATRTLLVFLKFSNRENNQKWLRDTLVKQLCYSDCSYTRMIFVKLCEHALALFPDKYYSENFLSHLMTFSQDKVPVIRYAFVNLLGQNKLVTNNTSIDPKYRSEFQERIKQMEQSEKDRDVKALLRVRLREQITPQKAKEHDDRQKRIIQSCALGSVITAPQPALKRAVSQVSAAASTILVAKAPRPYTPGPSTTSMRRATPPSGDTRQRK